MPLTLSNVPARLTLNNVPQQAQGAAMPMPVQPSPMGGLTLAQTRPDPEFNINTATNTFFKALGDRVASGQMTLDQARAAQAEMRALQLNPAMANRAAATEIAQRNLQVGPYSPNNVAAIGPMISRGPVPTAQPQGLTLSNVPQQGEVIQPMQGVRMAPQPMYQPAPPPPQNYRSDAPQGMALGGLMAKYRGGMC